MPSATDHSSNQNGTAAGGIPRRWRLLGFNELLTIRGPAWCSLPLVGVRSREFHEQGAALGGRHARTAVLTSGGRGPTARERTAT